MSLPASTTSIVTMSTLAASILIGAAHHQHSGLIIPPESINRIAITDGIHGATRIDDIDHIARIDIINRIAGIDHIARIGIPASIVIS